MKKSVLVDSITMWLFLLVISSYGQSKSLLRGRAKF
jgi:hypothetical protein